MISYRKFNKFITKSVQIVQYRFKIKILRSLSNDKLEAKRI